MVPAIGYRKYILILALGAGAESNKEPLLTCMFCICMLRFLDSVSSSSDAMLSFVTFSSCLLSSALRLLDSVRKISNSVLKLVAFSSCLLSLELRFLDSVSSSCDHGDALLSFVAFSN